MHRPLKMLDLFSGIGGFSLAAHWTGQIETVAFCEIEPFAQKVLRKNFPGVPIFEDVREVGLERLRTDGIDGVDVVTGGFPCQDLSCAGRQDGITGERSGLWGELCRIIGEVRPKFAVVENVPNLLAGERGAWFGRLLGDLAEIGYDAEWHCIPACSVGAHHRRDRVWIVAHPQGFYAQGLTCGPGKGEFGRSIGWKPEPAVDRVANGIPDRVDRLRCLGNAIVPQVAFEIFSAMLAAHREWVAS